MRNLEERQLPHRGREAPWVTMEPIAWQELKSNVLRPLAEFLRDRKLFNDRNREG